MGDVSTGNLLTVSKKSGCHSKGPTRYGGGIWVNKSDTTAAQQPVDPAWLATTLATLTDTYQVPGAQLAIHHAGTTITVEVGELEHGAGIPVTRETAFPIGSISKAWTATLAMILVADGDLELDAPLDMHLPELGYLGGELTLSHLLSHTSGFACSPDMREQSGLSLGRYVQEHCRPQDLIFPPGTGFSYSNRNYVAVGRLIETITGMSWSEAMESILLRPLDIDPVAGTPSTQTPSGHHIATGHSANMTVGQTRPVQQSLAPAETPAGGLTMSAVDLVS
jgi:CubicO group peptidase (beta-lactamase class C family)